MKHNLAILIILIFAVSCNSCSEKMTTNSIIGDWQGFTNFHVGGEHYEKMYLFRDFRIMQDSLYEINYPTSFGSKYKFNMSKDSIFIELDGSSLAYKWSVSDSILTLTSEADTTEYFRSRFNESYFNKIESDRFNTLILEKYIWRFDYPTTSQIGWKNIDTLIYDPLKSLNFKKTDYKLNSEGEIIIESDTLKILRFQKSHFITDSDKYLLQLQKTIASDTAILTYKTARIK